MLGFLAYLFFWKANVAFKAVRPRNGGHPMLGLEVRRDIEPGQELLATYDQLQAV